MPTYRPQKWEVVSVALIVALSSLSHPTAHAGVVQYTKTTLELHVVVDGVSESSMYPARPLPYVRRAGSTTTPVVPDVYAPLPDCREFGYYPPSPMSGGDTPSSWLDGQTSSWYNTTATISSALRTSGASYSYMPHPPLPCSFVSVVGYHAAPLSEQSVVYTGILENTTAEDASNRDSSTNYFQQTGVDMVGGAGGVDQGSGYGPHVRISYQKIATNATLSVKAVRVTRVYATDTATAAPPVLVSESSTAARGVFLRLVVVNSRRRQLKALRGGPDNLSPTRSNRTVTQVPSSIRLAAAPFTNAELLAKLNTLANTNLYHISGDLSDPLGAMRESRKAPTGADANLATPLSALDLPVSSLVAFNGTSISDEDTFELQQLLRAIRRVTRDVNVGSASLDSWEPPAADPAALAAYVPLQALSALGGALLGDAAAGASDWTRVDSMRLLLRVTKGVNAAGAALRSNYDQLAAVWSPLYDMNQECTDHREKAHVPLPGHEVAAGSDQYDTPHTNATSSTTSFQTATPTRCRLRVPPPPPPLALFDRSDVAKVSVRILDAYMRREELRSREVYLTTLSNRTMNNHTTTSASTPVKTEASNTPCFLIPILRNWTRALYTSALSPTQLNVSSSGAYSKAAGLSVDAAKAAAIAESDGHCDSSLYAGDAARSDYMKFVTSAAIRFYASIALMDNNNLKGTTSITDVNGVATFTKLRGLDCLSGADIRVVVRTVVPGIAPIFTTTPLVGIDDIKVFSRLQLTLRPRKNHVFLLSAPSNPLFAASGQDTASTDAILSDVDKEASNVQMALNAWSSAAVQRLKGLSRNASITRSFTVSISQTDKGVYVPPANTTTTTPPTTTAGPCPSPFHSALIEEFIHLDTHVMAPSTVPQYSLRTASASFDGGLAMVAPLGELLPGMHFMVLDSCCRPIKAMVRIEGEASGVTISSDSTSTGAPSDVYPQSYFTMPAPFVPPNLYGRGLTGSLIASTSPLSNFAANISDPAANQVFISMEALKGLLKEDRILSSHTAYYMRTDYSSSLSVGVSALSAVISPDNITIHPQILDPYRFLRRQGTGARVPRLTVGAAASDNGFVKLFSPDTGFNWNAELSPMGEVEGVMAEVNTTCGPSPKRIWGYCREDVLARWYSGSVTRDYYTSLRTDPVLEGGLRRQPATRWTAARTGASDLEALYSTTLLGVDGWNGDGVESNEVKWLIRLTSINPLTTTTAAPPTTTMTTTPTTTTSEPSNLSSLGSFSSAASTTTASTTTTATTTTATTTTTAPPTPSLGCKAGWEVMYEEYRTLASYAFLAVSRVAPVDGAMLSLVSSSYNVSSSGGSRVRPVVLGSTATSSASDYSPPNNLYSGAGARGHVPHIPVARSYAQVHPSTRSHTVTGLAPDGVCPVLTAIFHRTPKSTKDFVLRPFGDVSPNGGGPSQQDVSNLLTYVSLAPADTTSTGTTSDMTTNAKGGIETSLFSFQYSPIKTSLPAYLQPTAAPPVNVIGGPLKSTTYAQFLGRQVFTQSSVLDASNVSIPRTSLLPTSSSLWPLENWVGGDMLSPSSASWDGTIHRSSLSQRGWIQLEEAIWGGMGGSVSGSAYAGLNKALTAAATQVGVPVGDLFPVRLFEPLFSLFTAEPFLQAPVYLQMPPLAEIDPTTYRFTDSTASSDVPITGPQGTLIVPLKYSTTSFANSLLSTTTLALADKTASSSSSIATSDLDTASLYSAVDPYAVVEDPMNADTFPRTETLFSPAISSTAIPVRVDDIAANGVAFEWAFPIDAIDASTISTPADLAANVIVSSTLSKTQAPRGFSWVSENNMKVPQLRIVSRFYLAIGLHFDEIVTNQVRLNNDTASSWPDEWFMFGNSRTKTVDRLRRDFRNASSNLPPSVVGHQYVFQLYIAPNDLYRTYYDEEVSFSLSPSVLRAPYRLENVGFTTRLIPSERSALSTLAEVLSFLALPGEAVNIGPVVMSRYSSTCNVDEGLRLPLVLHPLQAPIGDSYAKYFVGALVLSSVVVFGITVVYFTLHKVFRLYGLAFPRYTMWLLYILYPSIALAGVRTASQLGKGLGDVSINTEGVLSTGDVSTDSVHSSTANVLVQYPEAPVMERTAQYLCLCFTVAWVLVFPGLFFQAGRQTRPTWRVARAGIKAAFSGEEQEETTGAAAPVDSHGMAVNVTDDRTVEKSVTAVHSARLHELLRRKSMVATRPQQAIHNGWSPYGDMQDRKSAAAKEQEELEKHWQEAVRNPIRALIAKINFKLLTIRDVHTNSILRFLLPEGHYDLTHADHMSFAVAFERVRGGTANYAVVDLIYPLLLALASFAPCPVRPVLSLAVVGVYGGYLLIVHPCVTIARNIVNLLIQVAIFTAISFYVAGAENLSRITFHVATIVASAVNFCSLLFVLWCSKVHRGIIKRLHQRLMAEDRRRTREAANGLGSTTRPSRKSTSISKWLTESLMSSPPIEDRIQEEDITHATTLFGLLLTAVTMLRGHLDSIHSAKPDVIFRRRRRLLKAHMVEENAARELRENHDEDDDEEDALEDTMGMLQRKRKKALDAITSLSKGHIEALKAVLGGRSTVRKIRRKSMKRDDVANASFSSMGGASEASDGGSDVDGGICVSMCPGSWCGRDSGDDNSSDASSAGGMSKRRRRGSSRFTQISFDDEGSSSDDSVIEFAEDLLRRGRGESLALSEAVAEYNVPNHNHNLSMGLTSHMPILAPTTGRKSEKTSEWQGDGPPPALRLEEDDFDDLNLIIEGTIGRASPPGSPSKSSLAASRKSKSWSRPTSPQGGADPFSDYYFNENDGDEEELELVDDDMPTNRLSTDLEAFYNSSPERINNRDFDPALIPLGNNDYGDLTMTKDEREIRDEQRRQFEVTRYGEEMAGVMHSYERNREAKRERVLEAVRVFQEKQERLLQNQVDMDLPYDDSRSDLVMPDSMYASYESMGDDLLSATAGSMGSAANPKRIRFAEGNDTPRSPLNPQQPKKSALRRTGVLGAAAVFGDDDDDTVVTHLFLTASGMQEVRVPRSQVDAAVSDAVRQMSKSKMRGTKGPDEVPKAAIKGLNEQIRKSYATNVYSPEEVERITFEREQFFSENRLHYLNEQRRLRALQQVEEQKGSKSKKRTAAISDFDGRIAEMQQFMEESKPVKDMFGRWRKPRTEDEVEL